MYSYCVQEQDFFRCIQHNPHPWKEGILGADMNHLTSVCVCVCVCAWCASLVSLLYGISNYLHMHAVIAAVHVSGYLEKHTIVDLHY